MENFAEEMLKAYYASTCEQLRRLDIILGCIYSNCLDSTDGLLEIVNTHEKYGVSITDMNVDIINNFGKKYFQISILVTDSKSSDYRRYIRNEYINIEKEEQIHDSFNEIIFILKTLERTEYFTYRSMLIYNLYEKTRLLFYPKIDKEQTKEATYTTPNTKLRVKRKQLCYLMIDEHTKYVKIGKSVNPLKRERTLQAEKPTIKLIHYFDGDYEDELHRKYDSVRVRGEWFKINMREVRNIIKQYA